MPNRLINEKSPYLRQHAYNPVDWYPWSKEAFEKAKREDKPVFLSIGYSTCHWCHVMEKESFEDEEIAEILNKHFVSIKVDREERPDIDSIYMNVCMMMTGRGGWPLTVFLTPDKKPFYAGTYFPKESSYTRIGLKDLLINIAELWQKDREKLINRADQIIHHLQDYGRVTEGKINPNIEHMLYEKLKDMFDPYYGGFGRKPKFPVPHNLLFLNRYYYKNKKQNAVEMVKHTLKNMRLGGIYDHIGFGFHRYSTDERWFLPHFEKMLYDQGMLLMAYTEGYLLTTEELFRETVDEIFQYLTREMLSLEGGFYSAEDADSEGEEGKFYVWGYDELEKILGKDFSLFEKVFNVIPEGNYREEHTGRPTGKNILYMKKTVKELSEELKIPEEKLKDKIENWRKRLFSERKKRVHPLKDTKILTDWNGLVIAGLSVASGIDKKYLKTARKAVDFILKNMKQSDGRLLHRYKDGVAEIDGFLSDYAYFIWGLIELYEKSFEEKYLIEAVNFTETVIKHFYDSKGGFFDTPDFGEELIVRPKESYDGAIPSANSVMVYNLFRLYRLTGNILYKNLAEKSLDCFSEKINSIPSGYSMMVLAHMWQTTPGRDIVITGERTEEITDRLIRKFAPFDTVIVKKNSQIDSISSHFKNIQPSKELKVYLCENFSCSSPLTDIREIEEKLIEKS